MAVLVLGATGLLGQAFVRHFKRQGIPYVSIARKGDVDHHIDIRETQQLLRFFDHYNPDIIINCIAVTDISLCEKDPALAWSINAKPIAALAHWSRQNNARLIHISTDHYYTYGGPMPHTENDPIEIVNEYAATKYAAEYFALIDPNALVIRTSIIGIRGWEQMTFAEWAINAILAKKPVMSFGDAYTSSIDTSSFVKIIMQMVDKGANGLYNVAAHGVFSKAEFINELARQMEQKTDHVEETTAAHLTPKRATDLGLNSYKAEKFLGYAFPQLQNVVQTILTDFKKRNVI